MISTADRALNAKQYSQLLGVGYSTFRSAIAAHPERFAPHFMVGGCKRWWESTAIAFHKGQETQGDAGTAQIFTLT